MRSIVEKPEAGLGFKKQSKHDLSLQCFYFLWNSGKNKETTKISCLNVATCHIGDTVSLWKKVIC